MLNLTQIAKVRLITYNQLKEQLVTLNIITNHNNKCEPTEQAVLLNIAIPTVSNYNGVPITNYNYDPELINYHIKNNIQLDEPESLSYIVDLDDII